MAQDFCDCPLYRITAVTLCSGCTQQAADWIAFPVKKVVFVL